MAISQTFEFQAQVPSVLRLMVESLYTQRDIFLRELISNASDALDTLRFAALTRADLMNSNDTLQIRLEVDRDLRTLSIADNGIGMTRDALISNIGTIAKSGTGELRDERDTLATPAVRNLIGRFGVGFYSAFMVAAKVSLLTRHASESAATLWESTGDGTYVIQEGEKSDRGTTVVLHLRDVDAEKGIEDYTDPWVLTRIVKQYSDFITYPILLEVEREQNVLAPSIESNQAPLTGTVERTLNSMKPLWTRRPGSVADEEYNECYKHLFHDWAVPLDKIHFDAEGTVPFQTLLFLPSKAPTDLYYAAYESGLRLYSNRVLVMEHCQDLLPRYLRFIKGVVDADLPLNISRQRLQQDCQIIRIRKHLTRKVLEVLQNIFSRDKKKYTDVWHQFGRALKEGVASDSDNRERILPLLLFQSSNDPEEPTTLAEYVTRMLPDQSDILYLTGESRTAVENSPQLEKVKDHGHEVLYLTEGVDELLLQYLHEFDGHKLKSVAKGQILLGTAEEKEREKQQLEALQNEYQGLTELLQKMLDRHVKRVCLTNRLTSSAVCLVVDEHDYSPMLERVLHKDGDAPKQRRVMELNPQHPLISRLLARYHNDPNDLALGDAAHTLFGLALVAEGSPLVDCARFSRAATAVLERAFSENTESIYEVRSSS